MVLTISKRPFVMPARILEKSSVFLPEEPMTRRSKGLRISRVPSSRHREIVRPRISSSTFQTSSKYARGTVPMTSPSKVPSGRRRGRVAVMTHSPFERALIGSPHSSPDPGCARWRMK